MSYICPNCGCKEATVANRWPEEHLCPFIEAECPECSTRESIYRDDAAFLEFEQRWRKIRRNPFKRARKQWDEPQHTDYREPTPMENHIYNDEHSEYL